MKTSTGGRGVPDEKQEQDGDNHKPQRNPKRAMP